jgi:5'-deoxy-5'-methylthioadenosine phosphorylase
MSILAIIGGTGLTSFDGLEIIEKRSVTTPFGQTSSDLLIGEFQRKPIIFLPRHGENHTIPPHKINYRANIWALHNQGVQQIVAIAAVGGINSNLSPGKLAVPDQIIDYTYDREQSFSSEDFTADKHIDFTYPYANNLRQKILIAASTQNIQLVDGGTYGATQGPRLETAAEIRRLKQDGCDMVGMTGMPEACLARELDMDYATCAVMANWAAGLSDSVITMADIEQTVDNSMVQIKQVLSELIRLQ